MPGKAWQRGVSLKRLQDLEADFDSYNRFAQHDLTRFKKNDIALAVSQGDLHMLGGRAVLHRTVTHSRTAIHMFPKVILGQKLPGDVHVRHMGYSSAADRKVIVRTLRSDPYYREANVWLFLHVENPEDVSIANAAGFQKVGSKYFSTADVLGVYYRGEKRLHPAVAPWEKLTVHPLKLDFRSAAKALRKQIEDHDLDFVDHYSNYNVKKSWSALSLRGYTRDPTFIEKPVEMSKAWKAQHQGTTFRMQDTPLRRRFPAVETILSKFPTAIHRVRLMRLKPGGGELARHTDQVDPDVGIADGGLMRLHVPLVTNPKVEFTSWGLDGEKTVVHMKEGECYYLDIRKPHTAINGGDTARIHLVVDVVANEAVRRLLR